MNWKKTDISSEQVKDLAGRFDIDLLTASILVRRGVTDPELLKYYLEDDNRLLHSPFLFEDMADVVDRILQAKEEGEKVLVYGDRDVDGITSTVLLTRYLQEDGYDVTWQVPLGDDAYGLTKDIVDEHAQNDGSLIITVDCGISNVEAIEYALEKGIESIIIDHHNPKEALPPAVGIINPKLPDCGYPFRDLAGCGVVSKVLWALDFAKTRHYGQQLCFLNVRPGNETYIVEVQQVENMVVTEGVVENLVPGVTELEQTRLLPFLQGQIICVYNEKAQKELLATVFGNAIDFQLYDLSEEIWKFLPSTKSASLLKLKEKSKLNKYKDAEITEIDLFCSLYFSLVMKSELQLQQHFLERLDLVSLGTIADLMPLENENRIIVKKGLKVLETTSRKPLQQLLAKQGLWGQKLSARDIAWQVTPILNSTGRMGQPDKAVKFLLSTDISEIETLTEEILKLNIERKRLGEDIWQTIQKSAEDSYRLHNENFVLVFDETMHRGITGIIAARLVQRFSVPACVLAMVEKKIVGSLRSTNGIGVLNLLHQCSDLFTEYGGHDFAAGFSMPPENMGAFTEKLERLVKNIETKDVDEDIITIDAEIPHNYMTPDLIQMIDRLSPYGEGSKPLVFVLKNAVIGGVKFIGKKEQSHAKFLLEAGKYKWPSIYWNGAEVVGVSIQQHDKVDVVFKLERNYFQNAENLQLNILDMRKSLQS